MTNSKKTYHVQRFSIETKEKSRHSVFRGLLLAMLSGICYSFGAVIVKQVQNIHPGQLSLIRVIAISVFSFPEAVKCQESLLGPEDQRFRLVLRGILAATSAFFNCLSFRYLPLGESAVIVFSLPVFVTVAARIFLKERCGYFQSVTAFSTVVGIILTSRIPLLLAGQSVTYSKDSIWGLIASVFSLISGTFQSILLRNLKCVHHSIIVFYSWVAIIVTAVLNAIFGDFKWHNCGFDALSIIALGVFSYGGQTLVTMALHCEMAGPVITVNSAVMIVMAFAWQTLMFRDVPDVFSSLGAVLVFLSVVFVAVRKWLSGLPSESTYRQKLSWILK